MVAEEEAREAADVKEVQVEAMDLGPFHTQTHMESKLPSMDIESTGETVDSTEGTLKVQEHQVLVDAPSEINNPPEHDLNGTSSSLSSLINEENKTSNEQLHEDSKKDHEKVETAYDGENTDQENKINKEEDDCVSHGETTTEDSILLKHEKEEEPSGDDRQDQDPMPETLKNDNDINHDQLVVDQQHFVELAKATEDTQPASLENIPNAEVVNEALDGIQSLDPNLDDEVVKADQQSKQADATDADAVEEDIPKNEETGVSEEMPKHEHADDSADAQEVFHQEPSEDANCMAHEKKEQTSQQSSMPSSDDTTSENDSTTLFGTACRTASQQISALPQPNATLLTRGRKQRWFNPTEKQRTSRSGSNPAYRASEGKSPPPTLLQPSVHPPRPPPDPACWHAATPPTLRRICSFTGRCGLVHQTNPSSVHLRRTCSGLLWPFWFVSSFTDVVRPHPLVWWRA